MTISEHVSGLSTAEVNKLKAAGEDNHFQNSSSRSNWDIIRTNLLIHV